MRFFFLKKDSLETIDLSYNDLREVDERAFKDLPWLATLKVKQSLIRHITTIRF